MLRQLIKTSCVALAISTTITTTTETAADAFIIPTGQFCPYRSEAWQEYKAHLQDVTKAHQRLLTTMVSNDPIGDIEDFLYQWERLTWYKETSTDYQLHEMEAELNLQSSSSSPSTTGQSRFHCRMDTIQNELIPYCRNLVQELKQQELQQHQMDQQQHQQQEGEQDVSGSTDADYYNLDSLLELQQLCMDTTLNDLSGESKIQAEPFLFAAFRKQPYQVQMEILRLLDDHKALIHKEGASFKAMKKFQQNRFLDKLRAIEERWEIAFMRFQLFQAEQIHDQRGEAKAAINPQYVQQCKDWLTELGMTEEQYKQLHAAYLKLPQPATSTGFGFGIRGSLYPQEEVFVEGGNHYGGPDAMMPEYYNSENAFQ